ncbi:hypothetical protein BH11BAC1_BH11BAC1_16750 [soil metagenome]
MRIPRDISGTELAHDPLKIGTLSAILTDVSIHLGISKQDLINQLFRN